MGERGREEEWGDKQTKGPRQCVTKMAGLYRKEKEREPGPGSLWDLTVYICVKLEFLVEKKNNNRKTNAWSGLQSKIQDNQNYLLHRETLSWGWGGDTFYIYKSLESFKS